MNLIEIKINGSTRLWAVQTTKFKKNLLSMWTFLPLGSKTTPCDLIFLRLLLRGCKAYPTNALMKRRLEELYGTRLNISNGYYGDSLQIGYTAEFLAENTVGAEESLLESVIELMGEVWHRPALDANGLFKDEQVQLAKKALCDVIRSEINNTATFATNRCREIMCEGEPYGYSTSIDEVNEVTAKALTDRYVNVRDSAYLTFFYVGSSDPNKVAGLLAKAFPAVPVLDEATKVPLFCPSPPDIVEMRRRDIVMPVQQSQLVMGYSCGVVMDDTRDYYAMCLMSDILGESPTSKLFTRLREQKSLCYYVGTYYENSKGLIYLSCGIDAENRKEAELEAIRCIEDICEGRFTPGEVESALLATINTLMQIEDSPHSILMFCKVRMLRGLSCDPKRFIENISSISREEIMAAARRMKAKAVFFLQGNAQAREDDCGNE